MFCGRVEDERVEEREEENERVSLKKSSQWGRLLASVVFTQTHEASIKGGKGWAATLGHRQKGNKKCNLCNGGGE